MKCPKCGSDDCIKDGKKIGKEGRSPAARCGSCGYRGLREWFIEGPKEPEKIPVKILPEKPIRKVVPLPTYEEIKKALGGLEPAVLPGCSIPKK